MFHQSRTPRLSAILLLACCQWPTQTNADGFGLSRPEVPSTNNGLGDFISASAAGSGRALAAISQQQIDSQLSGLATGDVVSIDNIGYVALRADKDAGQTGCRDMVILVQVEGNDRDSRTGAFPSVGRNGAGQSYIAPGGNNNNRQSMMVDGAAKSIDASGDSYWALFWAATADRQADAVATAAFNGGAGVNDASSLSSYASTALLANGANSRQSSVGWDHSSSYHPQGGSAKIIPTESMRCPVWMANMTQSYLKLELHRSAATGGETGVTTPMFNPPVRFRSTTFAPWTSNSLSSARKAPSSISGSLFADGRSMSIALHRPTITT